jgi:hypothetical protein
MFSIFKTLVTTSLVANLASAAPVEDGKVMVAWLQKQPSYAWQTVATMKGSPDEGTVTVSGRSQQGVGWIREATVENTALKVAGNAAKTVATVGSSAWGDPKALSGESDAVLLAKEQAILPLPLEELVSCIQGWKNPAQQPDGSITAELDTETSKKWVLAAMKERGTSSFIRNSLVCDSCKLQVWSKDGAPQKYRMEFALRVKVGFISKSIQRTTETTFSDFGSAKLNLPEAAAAGLK